VLLDTGNRVIALPDIKRGKRVIGDRPNHLGRLTRDPFPLTQIHNIVIYLLELRVERRKPGVEPLAGVVIGIDTGIVCGEVLHFVETVRDWIRLRLVAQVPFSGEIREITVLPEKLGNSRRLASQKVLIAGSNYN